MMRMKVIITICLAVIVGATTVLMLLITNSEKAINNKSTQGVGLSISAEKDFNSLKKNAEFIFYATIDGDYHVEKRVEDSQKGVYQIDRVYTATVKKTYKVLNDIRYKNGDKIEVIYPIGFKQMEDGKLGNELLPFGDEIIPIKTGEYMLFLDQLSRQFYFSNIHHIYKKGKNKKFHNISTDYIPKITVGNVITP